MKENSIVEQLKSLVFVDTETTGLNANVDRVIEIGIIRVEGGKITHKYSKIINPTIEVSEFSYKMTGIKKSEIKKAPTFEKIKNEIFDLLKGGLFVAHNAKFDYDFLDNEFMKVDMPFSVPQLCTVKLTRMLYPHFPRHDLDTVTQRLHLEIKKRHRAFDDAYSLWEILQIIMEKFPKEKVEHALSNLIVPGRRISVEKARSQMGMVI